MKNHLKEEWKPVVGFEKAYSVSSFGKIKRLRRSYKYVTRWGTEASFSLREKLLKPHKDKRGYCQVGLSFENKKERKDVHRLVAESHIKNCKNKKEVNHKNGIKFDNRLSNLEWVTRKENIDHAVKSGYNKNIMTIDEARLARFWLDAGANQRILAKVFKKSISSMQRLKYRKAYGILDNE